MGDMREDFDFLKEINKERRENRRKDAEPFMETVKGMVEKFSIDDNYTWNIRHNGRSIQFYPTKGTWQHRGCIYRGGPEKLIKWLEGKNPL